MSDMQSAGVFCVSMFFLEGSLVHVHQVSELSSEGRRFESCSCPHSSSISPSHPLTLGGGCTPRPILSYCVNPVSREQPRGLHYMSHTPAHAHRCPKTSLFDL